MPRLYLAIEIEKDVSDERVDAVPEREALLKVINLQAQAKSWRIVRVQRGIRRQTHQRPTRRK
ncbi:MAG: hypothetical protein AB7P69_03745 [Candidatus Binatia bacterium]